MILLAENSKSIPKRSKLKTGPNLLKIGVRSDICFYSTLAPGKKLKEIILYGHVLENNLLWFRQIHFQLAKIAPAKSGLK